jgi:hypothetical protein
LRTLHDASLHLVVQNRFVLQIVSNLLPRRSHAFCCITLTTVFLD